jgi:hypothetical protein
LNRFVLAATWALLALGCSQAAVTSPPESAPILVQLDPDVVISLVDQSDSLVTAGPAAMTSREIGERLAALEQGSSFFDRQGNRVTMGWYLGSCENRPIAVTTVTDIAATVDVYRGPTDNAFCADVGRPYGLTLEFNRLPSDFELVLHEGVPN